MAQEITEIHKLASLLYEIANDYDTPLKDQVACLRAHMILRRKMRKRTQQSGETYSPGKIKGAKIINLLKDQEVH